MADDTLQAESACENTSTPENKFMEAHAAWRHAKAEWELALYAPGMTDKDLPRADDIRLSENCCRKLDQFLRTRAESWGAFIWKLRAYRDEELFNNDNAAELISALVADAERLNLEARHGH